MVEKEVGSLTWEIEGYVWPQDIAHEGYEADMLYCDGSHATASALGNLAQCSAETMRLDNLLG